MGTVTTMPQSIDVNKMEPTTLFRNHRTMPQSTDGNEMDFQRNQQQHENTILYSRKISTCSTMESRQ